MSQVNKCVNRPFPSFPPRVAFLVFLSLACTLFATCYPDGPESSAPSRQEPALSVKAVREKASGGMVSYVEGAVTLFRNGAESPLEAGASVFEGDGVWTGKKSVCELSFPGLGRLMIAESTRMEVSSLDLVAQTAHFTDHVGTVFAKIDKLASKDAFMLRSRSVACGVRGTLFSMTVKKNDVSVAVAEGSVALYPDSLVVSGGHEVLLDTAQGALDAFPLVEAGKEAMCDTASFDRVGIAVSAAISEKKDVEGTTIALREAAVLVKATEKPLRPSAKENLEAFGDKAPPQDPSYLLSISPVEHDPDGMVEGLPWPSTGFWRREAVDPAATRAITQNEYQLWLDPGAEAVTNIVGGSAQFEVKKTIPGEFWRVKAGMSPRRLEQGKSYRLSFVAWADAPRLASFVINEPGVDYDGDGNLFSSINGYGEFTLGSEAERFTQIVHCTSPSAGSYQPVFHFGSREGLVWLRDYVLEELSPPQSADIDAAVGDGSSVPLNGSFSAGFIGWEHFSMAKEYQRFALVDGVMRYTQDTALPQAWHAQIFPQRPIPLSRGARYLLTFKARLRSEGEGAHGWTLHTCLCEYGIDYNADGQAYSMVSPSMRVPLSAEWMSYRLSFPVDSDLPGARLTFDLGETMGWTELDDIRLTRLE